MLTYLDHTQQLLTIRYVVGPIARVLLESFLALTLWDSWR
jgi:hypothetical protein